MSTIRSGTDAVEKPTKVEAGQRWQGPAYGAEPRTVARVCEAGACDKYKSCPPTARHAHFTSGTWASEPLMMREWSFLGYAETPGEARGRVADPCTCNDCGECFLAKAAKPVVKPAEPPKPTPPVIVRREVWGGGQWLDYARLGNAETAPEPFESYPKRREVDADGVGLALWTPPREPDPVANPRIAVTAGDAAGAAAAALVGR